MVISPLSGTISVIAGSVDSNEKLNISFLSSISSSLTGTVAQSVLGTLGVKATLMELGVRRSPEKQQQVILRI